MNTIKVSYQKGYTDDSTFYNQYIKLDKRFLKAINKEMKKAKHSTNIKQPYFFNHYDNIYCDELQKGKLNHATLTQQRLIKYVLDNLNVDTKRIKTDRNTVIEFI